MYRGKPAIAVTLYNSWNMKCMRRNEHMSYMFTMLHYWSRLLCFSWRFCTRFIFFPSLQCILVKVNYCKSAWGDIANSRTESCLLKTKLTDLLVFPVMLNEHRKCSCCLVGSTSSVSACNGSRLPLFFRMLCFPFLPLLFSCMACLLVS